VEWVDRGVDCCNSRSDGASRDLWVNKVQKYAACMPDGSVTCKALVHWCKTQVAAAVAVDALVPSRREAI
jgi:hypothetical protein